MIGFTKYLAGIAVATVLMTLVLAAQPARMSPQERTDKMVKDLSLTKEQTEKVLAIFTTAQDSMKAVFAEHQGDRDAMRPLMQKIRQDSDDQLKKVLTPEQYGKLLEQRGNAPARPRRGAATDSTKASAPAKAPAPTMPPDTSKPKP
jgi:periplasmic protein CpxP/Spy